MNDLAIGLTLNQMYEKHEDWGMTRHMLYQLLLEAAKEMFSPDYVEQIKTINLARLDFLYEKAMETGDVKAAIKAIEVQSRILDGSRPTLQVAGFADVNINFGF